MPEFFQTVMGRKFYEGTAPSIAKQLERIADALEESNRIERVKLGEERAERDKPHG